MLEQYHERFHKMAGRFITKFPALQGDPSMKDYLVNSTYIRVLSLPPDKQQDEQIVMKCAWYACMNEALWHTSLVMGRKLSTRGGGSKVPCPMHEYSDALRDAEYYIDITKRLEFGSFFTRLNKQSRKIVSLLLMGNNTIEIAKLLNYSPKSTKISVQRIRHVAKLYALGIVTDWNKTKPKRPTIWKCAADQLLPINLQQHQSIYELRTETLPKKEYIVC